MLDGKSKELIARRALEDRGFFVHDANVIFRQNCPNIDLVVFGKHGACYVQVKSSSKPASKDHITVDGSPFTEAQLFEGAPIFNRHLGEFQAKLVMIVEDRRDGERVFYLAPPDKVAYLAVKRGLAFIAKPKRDGTRRKMFRKEIPRVQLAKYKDAWQLLDL